MVRVDTEILVVGGGGSGLAAAIEAASLGRRVVVIEKNDNLGGSTGMSIGSLTAAGTADQRRLGISDLPSAHFEDMPKFDPAMADRDNVVLRRILTDNVGETVVWLRSMGVEFFGPQEEPPHRVARMHNVLPNSRSYIHHLSRRARRLHVDIQTGMRAEHIVVERGRAVAVDAKRKDGETVRFSASYGVVLAGGDYSNSPEMKNAFGAAVAAQVPGINPTATGDCQRMVTEIGGEIINGDLVLGPILRFVPPKRRKLIDSVPPVRLLTRTMKWALNRLPSAVIRPFVMSFMTTWLGPETSMLKNGAVLVGTNGRIIALEGRTPGQAIANEPDHSAYLIFDRRIAELFSAWPNFISTAPGIAYAYLPDYRRSRPDVLFSSPDLPHLARAISVPADVFVQSLASNPDVATYGAPFYALGPVKAYVALTDGGVRVSPKFQVLSAKGQVIPGLFAAGSTGQGGLLLNGHGHHIGWAMTSGRLAGRSASGLET